MKKKIGYIYTSGRRDRLEEVRQGQSPEDFFYGALELRRRGFDVEILEEEDFFQKKIFFNRIIYLFFYYLFGIDLRLFLSIFFDKSCLGKLQNCDIVIATTNTQGLCFSLLAFLNILKPKVVFLSMCFLMKNDSFIKKYVYKRIFRSAIVVVESRSEEVFLREFFDNKKEIYYVSFGVDPLFWSEHVGDMHDGEKYFVSIGNDGMRDYETLIRAWKKEYPLLRIVTRLDLEYLTKNAPANVEIIRGDWKKKYLTDVDIRQLILNSIAVIVPLRESLRSSGQSVSMISMSCSKTVLMSNIEGLSDKDVIQDEVNCLLVKPHSIEDMQRKVDTILTDKEKLKLVGGKAREVILNNFTIDHLADKLEKIICR